MAATTPKYVIFADIGDESECMMVASLPSAQRKYFLKNIVPALRPLADKDYVHGIGSIAQTAARSSQILLGADVYWCIEWSPGLVVVRFSPDEKLSWCVLRSPVPTFGGRDPLPEDEASYDEDDENHQYNLVFDAWDSQFDEDYQKERGFKRASAAIKNTFDAAFVHVRKLDDAIDRLCTTKAKTNLWLKQCKLHLENIVGDGIRVK